VILFDATMLLLAIKPHLIKPPIDEKTEAPVEEVEARVNALIEKIEKDKAHIIIPAPALSEVLIDAGNDIASIMQIIQKNAVFHIEPFDMKAAIELALMTISARKRKDKRSGVHATWAEVKFDYQIVAIAKVNNVTAIYSDDKNLKAFAEKFNIETIKISDLPIPQKDMKDMQEPLGFDKESENVIETQNL
jgi:predicted nucleic acid-binding protein